MLASLGDFLSHAGITLFLLLAILAWRDARNSLTGRLFTALAISLAALQITIRIGPAEIGVVPYAALRLVGAPNVALIWWSCLSLLRDDFRLGRWGWAGFAALLFAPLCYVVGDLGVHVPFWNAINVFGGIAPFAMVAHIVWIALSERRGDLVEARRRGRVWMVLIVMLGSVLSLLSEYIADPVMSGFVRDAIAILPAMLVLFLWLTQLDGRKLSFETPRPKGEVDPRDQALHRRLISMMEEDRAYLQPGLSIDGLAESLGVPAHHLRNLINSALGHRNFAGFLNSYRLAHAKAALGDAARGRDTVLAIAYESGFASLQTFNRVFRDVEGMTPTAFREQALASQN